MKSKMTAPAWNLHLEFHKNGQTALQLRSHEGEFGTSLLILREVLKTEDRWVVEKLNGLEVAEICRFPELVVSSVGNSMSL